MRSFPLWNPKNGSIEPFAQLPDTRRLRHQPTATVGAAISAWFAHSQVSPTFLVGKQTDCRAGYGWTSVLLPSGGGDSSFTLAGLLASPLLTRSRMSQLTNVPPPWSAAAT